MALIDMRWVLAPNAHATLINYRKEASCLRLTKAENEEPQPQNKRG